MFIRDMHKGAELASRPADFITSKINSGDKDSFTSFFEDGRKVCVGDRAGIFYSIDVRTGLVNRYVLSERKGAISNLLVTPAGYVYLSVAGQGTYEYDLAERRLQKINTEMNDAMVCLLYTSYSSRLRIPSVRPEYRQKRRR